MNDAFDREIDARERPERPIPAHLVTAGSVFIMGFGMLATGVGLIALLALQSSVEDAWAPMLAGLSLAALIIYYDAHHKQNLLSALIMGLCRMLVYVTAALVVTNRLGLPVAGGALVLLLYLIGLTYIAKQETLTEVRNLWPLLFLAAPFIYGLPALAMTSWAVLLYAGFLAWTAYAISRLVRREGRSIPGAVANLIAGISLLDALLITRMGEPDFAGWAVAGFGLTLVLQRYVSGT